MRSARSTQPPPVIPFPRPASAPGRSRLRLLRVADYVEIGALALWIGGIATIAAVAPVVFQIVPSRDLAGRVFGAMLERLFPILYVAVALLTASGGVRFAVTRSGGPAEIARWTLLGGMAALAVVVGVVISGEMRAIQTAFPAPIEQIALDDRARVRFNDLHKLSERLMGVAALLGLVFLPFAKRRWQGVR